LNFEPPVHQFTARPARLQAGGGSDVRNHGAPRLPPAGACAARVVCAGAGGGGRWFERQVARPRCSVRAGRR
jgi:hypothetical protein